MMSILNVYQSLYFQYFLTYFITFESSLIPSSTISIMNYYK